MISYFQKFNVSYLKMEEINVVNDFQMSWQDVLKHGAWPSFQSFWQHRVIGVSTGFDSDVPSLNKNIDILALFQFTEKTITNVTFVIPFPK